MRELTCLRNCRACCIVDASGKIVKETKVAREPEAVVGFSRGLSLPVTRIGLEAAPLSQWLHAKPVACVPGQPAEGTRSCIVKLGVLKRVRRSWRGAPNG